MGMLMKMTSRMDWMMMMASFSVFLFWTCLMLLVPGSDSTGRAQVSPLCQAAGRGMSLPWPECVTKGGCGDQGDLSCALGETRALQLPLGLASGTSSGVGHLGQHPAVTRSRTNLIY